RRSRPRPPRPSYLPGSVPAAVRRAPSRARGRVGRTAMRSIIVKIGSSSVTRSTGPDLVVLTGALDAALNARSLGWSVVLVSSGAVSSGSAYLARTSEIASSARLAAAVGQPFLMDIYRSVSDVSGRHVCQILMSE